VATTERPETASVTNGGEPQVATTDAPAWRDAALPVDARVEALLAALTLQEKLAQLGSMWLGYGGENTGNVAPMRDVLESQSITWDHARSYGLGHITRVFGTAPLTAADGIARVAALQHDIVDTMRLGVPAIVHEECLSGFTTLGATVYPTALAWAATFNTELIEQMSYAIGEDMARVGVHQGLSPVLDVVRDYRWGRVEETLGEDPYLVGMIGSAYVRGLQKAGIIATLKHFAGYSAARAARNHGPVSMGRREFLDVITTPFEMAIRLGGARSVMNSYSDVDGMPAAIDRSLLTGLLRDTWGFEGTVVSDYGAIAFLHTMHGVAPTLADAGRQALRAGLDVELPDTLCYGDSLLEVIESGELDVELVDRSVRRILRQKVELGLLDSDWTPEFSVRKGSGVDFDSARNRALARRVADESVVLLANNGILPLRTGAGSAPRIALVGPCADDAQTFMGCYSYPNHVLGDYPEFGLGVEADSLVIAVRNEFPDATVTFEPGCAISDLDPAAIPAAVRAARDADLCIAVLGDRAGLFGRGTSGEGCDAEDLRLPGVQGELLSRLLNAGTPVVVVIVSGRPYALGEYADRAAAMIQAFMPGEEGGAALAAILSGRVGPSGRLPVQIPRLPGGQPGTYLQPLLGSYSAGISNLDPTPLFPFGHGLSYTSYQYDNLSLSSDVLPTDGEIEVSIDVRNTGLRSGTEVVQLYVRDLWGQVTRPLRQLTGFARVPLEAGQAARVTFTVHADRTAFTGQELRRIVEPGDIEILVGPSAADLPHKATVALTGPTRYVGTDRIMTTPVRVNELS
jgi:beta-glucosidase-like glycosyl hydrolase